MKKSLILYCINLLRHCPDPWGTGGAPCRMGFPIDGGRQAGMCGIPCNTGSFRAASALSRAGMFRWPWPYRGWLPRFLPQRDVPRPAPFPAARMGHPAPEPSGPLPVGIPHFLRGGSTTYPQGLFACVTYFFLIYFLCWKQSVFASVFHHLFQPDSGSGTCGASQRRVQRNATQTPPHVFSRSDPPNAPVPALLLHQRRLPKAPASGSPFRRRRSVGGVLGNRVAELVRSP